MALSRVPAATVFCGPWVTAATGAAGTGIGIGATLEVDASPRGT